MSDKKMKAYITNMFKEIREESKSLILNAPTSQAAVQSVLDYVSSTVTSKSQSIIVSLYSALSKDTLSEPLFESDENANKFYDLHIRDRLFEAYKFDIEDLDSFKKGLNFSEVNTMYVTAASAVGSTTVGAILMGALSGTIDIPMVVIIAGALLCGVGGGFAGYKISTSYNQEKLDMNVDAFLSELEREMLRWVDKLTEFYSEQVEALKKTL